MLKTRTTADLWICAAVAFLMGLCYGLGLGKSRIALANAQLLHDLADCRQRYHQHLDNAGAQMLAFEREVDTANRRMQLILLQPLPPCGGVRR